LVRVPPQLVCGLGKLRRGSHRAGAQFTGVAATKAPLSWKIFPFAANIASGNLRPASINRTGNATPITPHAWRESGAVPTDRHSTFSARGGFRLPLWPVPATSTTAARLGWTLSYPIPTANALGNHGILGLTLELTIQQKDQLPDLILFSHAIFDGFAGVQHRTVIAATERISNLS
jgi:hypothetical protein